MTAAPAGARSTAAVPKISSGSRSNQLLQRKCACGASKSPLGNTCDECQSRAVQRKLAIGASNDPLELEADRIAEQVLSRSPTGPIAAGSLGIRRVAAQSGESTAAPPSVQRALAGVGTPLEPGLRQDMEQRFGHDFSRVRVHTGAAAEQSARDVNAHAYTLGHSIVFDTGRFTPATHEGRRLLAHELTHVVQQSGASEIQTARRGQAPSAPPATSASFSGLIQREVNPKRIASKEDVLEKIKRIVDSTGTGKDPAIANLARLGKLGIGFNPGATKEEKDNAFVYTCRCGWIDMGHFFISAAAAYGLGYQRRRLELRVGGKPHSIDELLGGTDKLTPYLDVLLKTVPDGQGKHVMANVRRLLQSGEPRDIALVLGYWMEFVQQVAKVISDPGRSLPDGFKEQLQGVLDKYQTMFKSVSRRTAGNSRRLGAQRLHHGRPALGLLWSGARTGRLEKDRWRQAGSAAHPWAHGEFFLRLRRRLSPGGQQDALRDDGRDHARLLSHGKRQGRLARGPRRARPAWQHQGATVEQCQTAVR